MTKCTPCRVRHLTCDQNTVCSECVKAGRDCVRGYNLRFRHLTCPSDKPSPAEYSKYEFFFDSEQTWVDSNEKVEFVPEDDDLSSTSSLETVARDNEADFVADMEPEQVFATTHHTLDAHPSARIEDQRGDLDERVSLNQLPLSNLEILANQSLADGSLSGETLHAGSTFSYPQTPVSTIGPVWPLRNLQEGRLLQHYITHLAPWFDVGDDERHFGKYVPCMAASIPLLMNAILALAALHHSRVIGDGDLCDAMDYHDRCLNMMVPMLSDPDRVNDDSVLITTILLHLYEDLDSGNDLTRHLKGTSIFFPAERTGKSSELRRAVFWIHLNQEIYNAYIHQRSVRTDFSLSDIESYTEDAGTGKWLHKILYIAAFVSKWAFGEDSSQSRWRELCQMVGDWEENRPSSFDPVYFRHRDPRQGKFFPEVCYVTDEGVTASHFFYMAKLLLTTHDPSIPRIGPRMKSAMAAMQETALSYVRIMVGGAICNNFVPARFTGSLAVIVCSGWFTDRGEQLALLDFMRKTDQCSGWPREHAQQALMQEWDWMKELI